MTSRNGSPGVMTQVFGWVLGLVVTCAVAVVLWFGVIKFMASTGLIRGPREPGPATAIESWFVHNWAIMLFVELVVGFLIAMRVCRPMLSGTTAAAAAQQAAAADRASRGS